MGGSDSGIWLKTSSLGCGEPSPKCDVHAVLPPNLCTKERNVVLCSLEAPHKPSLFTTSAIITCNAVATLVTAVVCGRSAGCPSPRREGAPIWSATKLVVDGTRERGSRQVATEAPPDFRGGNQWAGDSHGGGDAQNTSIQPQPQLAVRKMVRPTMMQE